MVRRQSPRHIAASHGWRLRALGTKIQILLNALRFPVSYGFGELDMLVPAYAATIHKSQGIGISAVIIPVLTQHYAMLQRNLLSIPASHAANGWSFWSGRRRPSSRCATSRAGVVGRSSASGSVPLPPSHCKRVSGRLAEGPTTDPTRIFCRTSRGFLNFRSWGRYHAAFPQCWNRIGNFGRCVCVLCRAYRTPV